MDDSDELELVNEDDGAGGLNRGNHPVRKRVVIKLHAGPKGRSNGAGVKKTRSKTAEGHAQHGEPENMDTIPAEAKLMDEEDIGKSLQFPAVKIGASVGEPLHHSQKLKWDHKVNLIGEKVTDPVIHSCEKCALPILLYGRMIPCKHVFCYACAKANEKNCPRCNQAVAKIEQSALGSVFVCTFGGTKHGVSGCHRTYLSQRDLQSHIMHRHRDSTATAARTAVAGPEYVPPARPAGPQVIAFNVIQPPPAIVQDPGGMVYQPHQPPPQTLAPHGAGTMQQMLSHPPPGMAQPPPGMSQPPPVMSQPPPGMGPPPAGQPQHMLPSGHVVMQQGLPGQAVILQPVQMGGHPQNMVQQSRASNLIAVQIHEEGDFRRGVEGQSGAIRVPYTHQPTQSTHEAHYSQQHYTSVSHQSPAVSFPGTDPHRVNVHQMMAHPGTPSAGQIGMMPPSQQPLMTTGPPPQVGGPQGMQQTMFSVPPPQVHSGPPPQGMQAGPPPQVMRPGPPPQQHGYPPSMGRQPPMSWPGPGSTSQPMTRLGPPPPAQRNDGQNQSIPWRQ